MICKPGNLLKKVGDELPKKAELQKIEKHFYVFPSETGNGIPCSCI